MRNKEPPTAACDWHRRPRDSRPGAPVRPARGRRGHPRTWNCGSLSGSGCGARVRLFHLLTLRQFDSLWARGREYFTASVLLIRDVKKKKKTGCLSSRLKYESESAGVKANKSKTLAELTKESNLCNSKQIKHGLQYRKLLGYTSNTMHWNRTNCWNCSGKLIATTQSSCTLARVLTSCGIAGRKWGTNGETKLKFVSVFAATFTTLIRIGQKCW